jgi:type I restriction-modification system DNA methylase subunit
LSASNQQDIFRLVAYLQLVLMSTPLPTEMTVRNFLTKELEKRAVKVQTEWSYTTPIGRLAPDMRLMNGAEYVVETKLGAESKLLDAIVRLYDYSKYTDAKGAFAILFPEELRRRWTTEMLEKIAVDPKLKYVVTAIFKDNRQSTKYEGNLSEVADWIASQVLKPLAVEADTGFAIKVLTEAVEAITLSVKSLKSKDLEEIFGGRTVFENILQYEEGHYPLDEMRQAATYLLVNQIIFYHVLSTANPQLEAIDEGKIRKPVDLLRYFEAVLKIDYTSVFGFDVASKLPESATDIIKRIVVVVKALAPEKIGHDVLGKVFHELIPFNIRKAVAAFYTNNEAAELLASLSIDKPDATVIDLACGSGTLLVAAYRRKRELLHCGSKGISLEDHKRFLEHDLTGVDIMPFAAHLAVMHLSLQALLHETEKVRVAVWDSTQLKPNMSIPAIFSELKAAYRKPTLDMFRDKFVIPEDAHIKKGAVTLEGVGGQEIPLEKVDLVIMNPPFTRQERLPKEYKDGLSKRLGEYKSELSGQLGLWGYFLLLADRFVKEGGRIALVYPSRPLSAKSARQIRKFISNNYDVEYIVTSWQRSAFSESTQYREILLILKKLHLSGEHETLNCKIVNLKSLPRNMEEVHSTAKEMKKLTSEYNNERIMAATITQEELKETLDNWFVHIASFDPRISKTWMSLRSHAIKRLLPFRDYLRKRKLDIIRGVETRGYFGFPFYEAFVVRHSNRALKSYDLWFAEKIGDRKILARNRFTNETIEIASKKLCYGVRRASGMNIIDLSDSQDFVVIEPFEGIERLLPSKSVQNFKRHCESWRQYVRSRFGKFLVSRRFNLSASGTHFLAYYSREPTTGQNLWSLKGANDEEARILSLWFNSTLNLLQVYLQRVETEGAWMEINDGMLNSFLLLDIGSLSKNEKKQLLDLFEKIGMTESPSILDQLKNEFAPRKKLDIMLLRIMGYSENDADLLLDYLYPALAEEIEKLKTLMEG